ncbi:MAG: serine hydrolase [Parafilimonas sp.]
MQALFYFRDTEKTEWAGYNEDEKYNPGSLMKVPELISYLLLEEDKPGTLNKEYFYAAPFITEKNPVFISKPLQAGKSYSVKELLQYMITYSDNNATVVLDQHLDQRYFKKTLTDLSLPIPDSTAINYPISTRDFSLFFRAIYNASYLTIPHSEYAAELLSTCNFNEGFAKGIPASVKMIHKFGESGSTQVHQWHESGIIYVNNKPYILTVMTNGTDLKKLATVISDIAGIMYQQVSTS